MASDTAVGLLEREDETGQLEAALDRACKRGGGMVLVEGVAGIGKTRLLDASRGLAEERGMRVLSARGTEFERGFAFGVVRQLLEPVVRAAGGEERDELLAGAAAPAGAVFGVASPETTTSEGTFAELNGLYWLLVTLAERAPLALLVDDVQWSDPWSVRFLKFLLPRLDGVPVAAIVAGRPAEPGADVDVLADMAADRTAVELHPSVLSTGAVAALVRSRLNPAAGDDVCAACHDACGGNPFLLSELLTELRRKGDGLPDAAEVRRLAPRSVQRSVVARIDGLGPDARAVARAVAVLGDGVAGPLAGELAGVEAGAVEEAADALATIGVLEADRPLRFVHPLVRNAVYSDLTAGEALRAHAEAARLLERSGAEPERVGLHLLAAEPGADAGVVAQLMVAARAALARSAPEAAVAYLRRALAERAEPAARRPAVRLLVTAAQYAIDPDAFDGIPDDPAAEIATAGDPQLTELLASWLHMTLRADAAIAVLSDAVERAEKDGEVGQILRFDSLRVLFAQLPPTEARSRLDPYGERVEPGSAPERQLLALRSHWMSLAGDSAEQTADCAKRALAGGVVFDEHPDALPNSQAIVALLLCEELDAADVALVHWLDVSRRRGSDFGVCGATICRGRLEHLRGDTALAEDTLRTGLALMGEVLALAPPFVGWLIETLLERDDVAAADRELRSAGLDGSLTDPYWGTRARFSRGQLRLAQGRNAEALADLRAVGEYMAASEERNPAWMPWGTFAAPALAASGLEDEARAVVEDELEQARRWGAPAPIGRALRVLAGLERGPRRFELLEEAVAVLEPSPIRLEYLRALCDLGTALRHERRPADARDPLRAVLAEAGRRGAVAIARRAHDELEASGEAVRPFMASGVESLTPSERRIAGMAAEGMSNRDIAQGLFLTVKTVETHLSASYRKLGITRRGELANALAD